ncbi:hypothetical protein BOTBODRAFT_146450 [Botryobasidium botryosum FD-172 SS1]|uniref:Uncharacterized protein n=1 Tax=Botryobasidium botryosum (strain FD-172 SS1) TaxID=930990 RepID=A0A067MM23_BOTB1|nr:hypothetical protein BOTBODRAFT_146450 [Botryobasidium botryosum FD-172 SS1]
MSSAVTGWLPRVCPEWRRQPKAASIPVPARRSPHQDIQILWSLHETGVARESKNLPRTTAHETYDGNHPSHARHYALYDESMQVIATRSFRRKERYLVDHLCFGMPPAARNLAAPRLLLFAWKISPSVRPRTHTGATEKAATPPEPVWWFGRSRVSTLSIGLEQAPMQSYARPSTGSGNPTPTIFESLEIGN